MSDPMQEIMASFFVECEELHEALIDALQAMADGAHDAETINVAFRAVHSIKGGTGAFGLEDLVSFAHQFETVMDACRAGDQEIVDPLVNLFLRCGDFLSDLIRCSRDGETPDAGTSSALITELASWVSAEEEPEEEIEFQPMTLDLSLDGDGMEGLALPDLGDLPDFADLDLAPPPEDDDGGDGTPHLQITFKPDPELYISGNETLFLVRTLADLGDCEVALDFEPPETVADLDRLGGRLSWHIKVETDAPASAVHEIFEFATGLCHLEVIEKNKGVTPSEVSEPTEAVLATAADDIIDLAPSPPTDVALAPAESEAPMPPPSEPAPAPAVNDKVTKAPPAKASPTVRVDLERIERLVNLVGELVINQAMLSQSIAEENIPPNSPVSAGLDEFMQLTRNIQESVMMIRAQPVKSLFQRMSRIVREASAAVDKSVQVCHRRRVHRNRQDRDRMSGRSADPHDPQCRRSRTEKTETRLANGKSRQGEIRLAAAHKSGRVVIDVSDDGGGINREKVRSIAVSKGLIPDDANLTDGEIDQLLFLPGFSTADEVSALSGRGVGMDVVKTQITSLGGRVSIKSTPGQGTKFSISLPLTLAVLDGMVVTVADETLVIPLNAIVETLSLSASDLSPVSPGQMVLCVRDKFVPVLDLGKELGYRNNPAVDAGTIALLISPEEGVLVAMLVDTIEDQRQVVIKGLQQSYGRVHGVAAATILGNGKIALILDTNDLVQNASGVGLEIKQMEAS